MEALVHLARHKFNKMYDNDGSAQLEHLLTDFVSNHAKLLVPNEFRARLAGSDSAHLILDNIDVFCGHLYCAKCIATHSSVQRAANRPVNCPCCLRPVAPTEMHAWASPPRQPRTSGVPRGVRVRGRARQPSWNDVVTACAASRSAAEWSETAASSSTVEAPELSREEQRAFRRAAARLKLRRCPSCDAPVQKNGGCNHMSCLCGAEFQWERATPFVACQTYHYDSDKGRYCCQHCSPAAYAKLGAVRLATGAAIAPAATVAAAAAATVVFAGGSVAAAVAVVPAAVFGPPALVY